MTIPAIFDIRGLRERLSRAIAPAPLAPAPPQDDGDADPLSPAAAWYLRDLFDDPLVADGDGLPAPLHPAPDLHRDPVRATARAVAHAGWRP